MAKKKTYSKPEIKQVELAPEEAVLTNCKIGGSGAKAISCSRTQAGCTASAPGS